MTKPLPPPSTDHTAEGVSHPREDSERGYPLQTATVAVVKANKDHPPAAETGLLPAVMAMPHEGQDHAESQDSSRTTAENQAMPMSQKASETVSTRSPAILIIEDTTELAEVIQAALERIHMLTAHETHGGKALTRFEEFKPDVVLLDIGLPDMTGWKFLEAIKEKYKDKLPIIIVITAYGDPANRLVAKLQGVHDYLIKPFTPDEVEKVVTSALKTKTA